VISVKNLSVDLGDFRLAGATFDVHEGEYFIILGPTGAGKTVLLESIAGLFPIKNGSITVGGSDITYMLPEKRGIGFVYQDLSLFPHLSVMDNVTYGIRRRGKSKKIAEQSAGWVIDLLNISDLLQRRPDTLSGGEKQKVALARALVMEPRLLLLDEPLGALDPNTREQIQSELRNIHRKLNLTIIHVTHDFEEAVLLGNRIGVIGEGRLLQVGTPDEIFRQPNSEFVAHFSMARNIFSGEIQNGDTEHAFVTIEGTRLAVISDKRGKVKFSIRPEDILLSAHPIASSARNSFKGTITEVVSKGSTVLLTVNIPPSVVCLVTRHSFDEMNLHKGGEVYVTFKAAAVNVF